MSGENSCVPKRRNIECEDFVHVLTAWGDAKCCTKDHLFLKQCVVVGVDCTKLQHFGVSCILETGLVFFGKWVSVSQGTALSFLGHQSHFSGKRVFLENWLRAMLSVEASIWFSQGSKKPVSASREPIPLFGVYRCHNAVDCNVL